MKTISEAPFFNLSIPWNKWKSKEKRYIHYYPVWMHPGTSDLCKRTHTEEKYLNMGAAYLESWALTWSRVIVEDESYSKSSLYFHAEEYLTTVQRLEDRDKLSSQYLMKKNKHLDSQNISFKEYMDKVDIVIPENILEDFPLPEREISEIIVDLLLDIVDSKFELTNSQWKEYVVRSAENYYKNNSNEVRELILSTSFGHMYDESEALNYVQLCGFLDLYSSAIIKYPAANIPSFMHYCILYHRFLEYCIHILKN